MGATESKLRCLFLPAQSGKTRKVQEEIRSFKDICRLTSTRSLDILISANNRLLVYQTTSRMKKDLGAGAGADSDTASIDTEDPTAIAAAEEEETVPSNAAIEGAIFSWTSGAVSNIKPSELMLQILVGDVEMLLLCANRRRLNYLAEMLLLLTSHRRFRADPIDINIWIDEADSSISIWRTYPQILTLPAVTRVTLVSATFDSVLRRYGALRVIPYAVTHPDVYRRLRDCTRRIVPCPRGVGTEDYILQVLCGADHARLTAPGQRAFIPGDFTKDSHAMIAEVLGALGFTVILLNGERKELLVPGQAPRDLRKHLTITDPDTIPEEFNQTLAQLYTDLDLARFPLAITGYLCIQRGVTFQCAPTDTHGGFVFDYGIIPPIRQAAEAYQMTARLFGNVGAFPNYTTPATIYTDESTFDRIEREEEAAVNLPRMVHAESLETVTAEDFKRAISNTNKTAETGVEVYSSMEELVAGWSALYFQKKGVLPPTTPRTPRRNAEGAYTCSIGGTSIRQTIGAVREFLRGGTAKSWGSAMTDAAVGSLLQRVYVGYDGDAPTFFLRWAIKGGSSSEDVISYT